MLAIVIGKGLAFVMLPIVTGALSPAEFGALELLIAITDVGGVFLGLGLADTLFRFAAEAPRKVATTLWGMALALALLGGLALQLLIPLVMPWMPGPITTLDMQLVAATLALTSLIQVPLAWLRFRDAAWTFLMVEAAKSLIQAGSITTLLYFDQGITGILLGGLIANGLIALYLGFSLYRESGVALEPARAGMMVVYALPLVLSGSFGFILGSFDRWMLAPHISLEILGHYGLAAKFALLAAFAMQPFDMWWYPKRIGLLSSAEGRGHARDVVRFGCVMASAVTLVAMVLGPEVICLLTPHNYHAAGQILPWLLLVKLLHQYSNLLNVGCYAQRSTVQPMIINAASAALVVLGYLWLIPNLGFAGAIAALIIAQAFRLLVFAHASQEFARIAHQPLQLAWPVLLIAPPLAANLLGESPYHFEIYAFSIFGMLIALFLSAKPLRGPEQRPLRIKVGS